MKKTTLILASLLILGAIFFYSCKKDESISNKTNNTSKPIRLKSDSKNPFDFVGINHNAYLDYFAEHYDVNKITDANIYDANVHFLTKYSLSFDEFQKQLLSNQSISINLSKGDYSYIDNNKNIDNSSKSYLKQFYSLIDSLSKNCTELVTSDQFNSLISAIEQNVIAEGLYSSPDNTDSLNCPATVLCVLSIAKYSYSYWYNAYIDKNNPWHNIVYSTVNTKNRSFFGALWHGIVTAVKVIVTPVADVVGFVTTPPGLNGTWNLGDCFQHAGETSLSLWE